MQVSAKWKTYIMALLTGVLFITSAATGADYTDISSGESKQ